MNWKVIDIQTGRICSSFRTIEGAAQYLKELAEWHPTYAIMAI